MQKPECGVSGGRRLSRWLFGVLICGVIAAPLHAETPRLELKHGDHLCFIGNTLADRMQHHGWLETLLQARFPQHELVIRNLGFSADEITVRPRSMNFGSPDEHLTRCKADVIFAFFGYNESFGDEAGLPKFRKDLAQFIEHTFGQKYNGRTAPRLVIFSPIAHEDLKNRLLPDGRENNRRLELYTRAMAEVAAAKGVPFVDLFHPTRELYEKTAEPLTINGIHLTVQGNRKLAEIITESLFGAADGYDKDYLERLRQAVLDKNLHWFNVYRTTDGYSVFGGRSQLKFVGGQTNYEVMQRELQILEVMTANRDRRIWAVARGGDLKVDDSNTPPPLEVKTNKPGPLEGGRHIFLGGEEAIGNMQVAKGMQVNLFASEEMFPELVNPVQAAVDPDGRLWVAAWPTYPHWNPKKEMNDKLLILPDDDRDGKADRCIVFADHLHNPTGFEFFAGGVLLAQAPDIVFLKDTDGDDRADVKIRVLHGLDSADTHHTANSFVIGPDGGLYFQRGVFHVTNVETPWGPPFRSTSTGMYRFDPRTWQFDLHFKIGPNPHGDVFDKWGYQFATDGTSGTGYYVAFPKHGTPKQLYTKRFRPVPAIQILSSEHFPPENQGNLLICNVIGFQGVGQYRFIDQGAGFHAVEIEPILVSSDPNFRPVDLEIAGDGALYVLDWQNPLIGHMQHNLRDPNRDHEHGRVYRVSVPGRPLLKPIKMKGRPIPEILNHLTSPTNSVRYRARLELTGRDDFEVAEAAAEWAQQWDPKNPDHALPLVEALWLHQQHKVVNAALLKKVLQCVEPNARAAAVRVLREWAPKIPDAYEILIQAANDEHPRVRHEAVVAAALNPGPLSAEVIFAAEQWPTDLQLEYTLREARKEIDVDAYIQHALATGRKLSPAARQYMLRNASIDQLLKLEKTEAVYRAILTRERVAAQARREALEGWAQLTGRDPLELLLELIVELDRKQQAETLAAYADLVKAYGTERWRTHLRTARRLVRASRTPEARRLGYLAWMIADGHVDDAYAYALKAEDRFVEFLQAATLLEDAALKRELYGRLRPLMFELPEGWTSGGGAAVRAPGLEVAYYHPSASDVAIETLQKMKPVATGVTDEISLKLPIIKQRDRFALLFRGQLVVPETGTYTFYVASDDGSRLYIDGKLVVNNDGLHGMVEKRGRVNLAAGAHDFVLTYFDNGGNDGLRVAWSGPGFSKRAIPADAFSLAGQRTLADAIIELVAGLGVQPSDTFADLLRLLQQGRNRAAVIAGLQRIPPSAWPKSLALPLANSLIAYLTELPTRFRTTGTAKQAVALARRAAEMLPAPVAKEIEQRLQNLDVRVIAIGTVPHRMIYDKEQIVVQAGKPVEFRFTNTDNMPHNFCITLPGAMEEVGTLAEQTARDPDAMQRQYVPRTDKILLASRLLQPGESQTLLFEVPATPGIYPYICTYPGHWRRMYGALYVVEDFAAYQANPVDYLAKHPLPIKDEMLKYVSRGREWTLAELEPDLERLGEGRVFEVGKQLFKVAACVACHKLNGEGQQIGPDLTKLDPKLTPRDVLESILEPSKKINEKYQSYAFVLADGRVIKGLILEETNDAVTVIENPLARTRPILIPKEDIEEQVKSDTSLMPKGLLNKLTREEILDLLAYVYARGNPNHEFFKKHHDH